MADAARLDELPEAPARTGGRASQALIRRLTDVVCLPASRVNAFERAVTGDLLVDMLRDVPAGVRKKVADRLSNLVDIPHPLLRMLLRDSAEIATPLLANAPAIGDSDLIGCAREGTQEHRRLIALRRGVNDVVCEVLVEAGEPAVIEVLLRNVEARLSPVVVEALVAASRRHPAYIALLLRRPELRPSHAYVLFWWADSDCRRLILSRFAVDRQVLQDLSSDLFQMAAAEGWQDPQVRKALQFIERRQRNRAAVERSPYASLEEAVAATQHGMTRDLVREIAYLSGLKPMTAAKILTDPQGEPLAILCKATGLPRTAIPALWRALRRPEADSEGHVAPGLERTLILFDMMAVDRAQTVLRYWNWALTSALTPSLIRAIRVGDDDASDDLTPAQRAAMLALADDFGG